MIIYLNRKLRDINNEAVITSVYFLGSIVRSLQEFYGEVTTVCSELELLKFDPQKKRGTLKVPSNFYIETRAAIALISHYQDIPCHFNVINTSQELPVKK